VSQYRTSPLSSRAKPGTQPGAEVGLANPLRCFASHLAAPFSRRIEALNERKLKTLIEMKTESQLGVDKGLVALFLRMSPEERLRANDNAIRAILELRNACQQQKINGR
jgi:hypothetical protein